MPPEDSLAKEGLTSLDIRQAFQSQSKYDEVTTKLQQSGDYMRKEYAFLLDNSGDTVFSSSAAWDRYDVFVKTLKVHGEKIEVADYIRQVSFTKNILGRAAENKALHKVFAAAHWADRLPDMLNLQP